MTIYAWTPCSDGTIKKVDATSVVMSVSTGCTETWIASVNKLALVPGRRGEVVSMNGLGTIKDRRTLQHRVAIAVGIINDVYCFDGRGKGTVVTLDNNGLITVGEKFTCPGVIDPMNAILDGTTIYIACRNEDVYSFETTTEVITRVSRNHNDVLTSVVDADTITKLRNNAIYARLFSGASRGGTDYFIGNGAIITSTNSIIDSRIRSDGVCSQVGSTGTQYVKSCPSRKAMQWISGGVVSGEVSLSSMPGMFVFSNSDRPSNETVVNLGSGVFQPDTVVESPAGYGLTWKCALSVFLTDRVMAVQPVTSIGGAASARVSWEQYLDPTGTDCGTFGSYISGHHVSGEVFMYLNIWQALRDGVWSGSISIPVNIVHAKGAFDPPTFEVGNWDIVGGVYIDGVPHASILLSAVSYNYVSPCATPFTTSKTVTFYEDGTLSVA